MLRDLAQRGGQSRAERARLDAAERVVGEVVAGRGRQLAAPALAPEVMAQQVGRDAVEPGPGVVVARVEAGALVEGDPEGLGGEVLPRRPGAAHAPAVDRRPVAVEDARERRRVGQRRRDQGGVRRQLLVKH